MTGVHSTAVRGLPLTFDGIILKGLGEGSGAGVRSEAMARRRLTVAMGIVAFLVCATSRARAQQCDWLPGEGMPGMDDAVFAMTTWDPDGPGPLPQLLVAGGVFGLAGNVLVNNIAAWDGSAWQPLGAGIGGDGPPGYVWALAVYNGALIAGGDFTTAGGVTCNDIASWDGSAWQPLGGGMSGGGLYAGVYALAVYNGELIAGGDFTTAGGVTCSRIARWDGNAWQPLGSGMDGGVCALTVWNGELIAGGDFTTAGGVPCDSIARWDGSTWQPLGSGMFPWVQVLTVYNGDLIAGGPFTIAGGVTCNGVARWDGSNWQALGSGISGSSMPMVFALAVFNGELIAGGDFTTAGGHPVSHIARWACTPCLGDLNCDGVIDFGDINPFVAHLCNFDGWQAAHPGCPPQNGDINGDGTCGQGSFGDINPFVELLINGQGPCP
jgi:hypothetical protein